MTQERMSAAQADYDAAKDGHDSYFAAIEAKRLRGDAHDWEDRKRKPEPEARS